MSRYTHHIYEYDGYWDFRFADYPEFKIVTRIDNAILPGSNFYQVHWLLPQDAPSHDSGHPPHIHKDPELLFHIGSDPQNPQDLGAEVEIYLGRELERHVISRSCVIFIPPNFLHGPWRPLRTYGPWIFIQVDQGLNHTEKGYHQMLPADVIERNQEFFGIFEDEGY